MNVVTTDVLGRKTVRVVPENAPETTWNAGVMVGPPDLSSLGFNEEVTTRLHNELFNRGIIRRLDAKFKRSEVHAALMSALRVDADRIITIFEAEGN